MASIARHSEHFFELRQKNSALREAAERVRLAAPDIAPGVAPQEVSCEIQRLCDLIERDDSHFSHSDDTAAAKLSLRRRLFDRLRAETLRAWSDSPPSDPAEMLKVLHGFERAYATLEAAPLYDEVRQQLSDSRGLEMVVELAHDLRSPLTSILFLSETLMRGGSGPVSDIQQRQLGIIYSAALRLIGTASDVIELAHAGGLEANESTVFALSEMLEPIRDMVMPIAEEKGLIIRLNCPVPNNRVGFPIPLSRVLLNLTTNALKFTDQGSVELSVRPLGISRLEFSVRDTGPGISDEALATLYEPIRRRSGGRPGYQITGTGLGLSICQKLVAEMGGELQLETRPSWGTRFFFELELPQAE
ncbi:MAG TPA: HAMP domain-containing sensor histidine kinase [Longimicrobiales bacterium]